jgi:hypothetical protein
MHQRVANQLLFRQAQIVHDRHKPKMVSEIVPEKPPWYRKRGIDRRR